MFRIITLKQHKFSQSDPVLIRQFPKKLQSEPVLILPKLASLLIQSDPVLSVLISDAQHCMLIAEHTLLCGVYFASRAVILPVAEHD